MSRNTILGLIGATMFSFSVQAAVIFEDNFDGEAGSTGASSLNYSTFANWTVSEGTVDVVSNGGWGISCAGSTGKCVDLDGSSGNAGKLTSTLIGLDAGNYTLSFDLSGNQRSGSDFMVMSLAGFVNDSFSLSSNADWQTYNYSFSVGADTSNSIIFNHDGGDNVGIMLDNVRLVSNVPEPSIVALFVTGLLGLRFARRRKA